MRTLKSVLAPVLIAAAAFAAVAPVAATAAPPVPVAASYTHAWG